jgi:predicted house-cleaning noncanonical NTP pyrophosphatase (MazG superfamily)
MNFDKEKLESLRKEKAERRGGFKEKIILDAVEER